MTDPLLVTGFLAFGQFDVNPSALLARRCGWRFELLEVSFAAVDDFLQRRRGDSTIGALLMLGVSAGRRHVEVERVMRNEIGEMPDVRGVVRGVAPVELGGPPEIPTTLFPHLNGPPEQFSDDAGCDLCNYACYRALRLMPDKRIAFVHVPPVDVMPLDHQQRELARLIDAIDLSPR